ncbi:MAG TPA: sigma-70 family RNA polymerase sigma factor [Blastocatellia bacterium]
MSEAELGLWERYRLGDEAAHRELLLFYLPLVDLLAKRVARSAGWANLEDLKQDGVIGLMKAITKFDPSRGVDFKIFAKPYIRGAIFDSSELTRGLARRQAEIYRMVTQAQGELLKKLHRNATIEAVAEKTNLTIEQIQNAIDAMGVAFAGELPEAENWLATRRLEPERTETKVLLKEALSQLTEREALIIIWYYLHGQSPEEIGHRLGLTMSNVTKIRQRALGKLRALLGGGSERRA